jgi:hypothetical protein
MEELPELCLKWSASKPPPSKATDIGREDDNGDKEGQKIRRKSRRRGEMWRCLYPQPPCPQPPRTFSLRTVEGGDGFRGTGFASGYAV